MTTTAKALRRELACVSNSCNGAGVFGRQKRGGKWGSPEPDHSWPVGHGENLVFCSKCDGAGV